jgi:hypothetical protein
MPKYLPPANRKKGRISQWLLAKTWQFLSLFSEGLRFCSRFIKVERAVKNLSMVAGSFLIFSLSNHNTFSQTRTSATVLLIGYMSGAGPEVREMETFCASPSTCSCYRSPLQYCQVRRMLFFKIGGT